MCSCTSPYVRSKLGSVKTKHNHQSLLNVRNYRNTVKTATLH